MNDCRDFKCAGGVSNRGRGPHEQVAGVILRSPKIARLDEHFETLLQDAPAFAMLANPGPARAKFAFELIGEQNFLRNSSQVKKTGCERYHAEQMDGEKAIN